MDLGIALLTLSTAAAAAAPAPTKLDPRLPEYCSLIRQCGLPAGAMACSDDVSGGVEGVVYDAPRCLEARTLVQRGITPADSARYGLFRFLGRRYRVVYEMTGELPMSPARFSYLVDDLPLAARLLTDLQKVAYTAEYVGPERSKFKVSREGTMTASAERILGTAQEGTLYYFGYGTSQLGPWKLRGQGLVEVRYAQTPGRRGLRYSIRILASPANAVVNAFMNMGLFRSAVRGRIEEVIEDVKKASDALDRRGINAVARASWPEDERHRLEQLLTLP